MIVINKMLQLEAVIKNLISAAKEVYPSSELMQQVAVTQALLESGYIQRPGGSRLAREYNNLFGIKGEGTHTPSYILLPTQEVIKGKAITVMAKFAWNSTQADSFRQHSRVLGLKRYARVRDARSLPEAFQALRAGGYATDPKYPEKLTNIWQQYVKPYYVDNG